MGSQSSRSEYAFHKDGAVGLSLVGFMNGWRLGCCGSGFGDDLVVISGYWTVFVCTSVLPLISEG